MYVKIKTNRNVAQSLRYHEQKIDQRKASCILAENFLKDTEDLTWKDKLSHFQRLNSLNERTKVNTVHISMNFHPSELLSNDKMKQLATEYMTGIGLGEQPFLVYRHDDANHPHLHLVSTKIREDGVRIDLGKAIRRESLKISRELEIRHSLVKLRKKDIRQIQGFGINGEGSATGQTIEKALGEIVPHYKYTNLSELNALLGLYHVEAYRGKETSRLYQKRGLLYRLIDDKGQRISAPIKASAFEIQPTLKNLEKRFVQNQADRESHRQHLTTAIDWAFYKRSPSLEGFKAALAREQIDAILQKDVNGKLQDILYVDHLRKTVFDGKTLGGGYTADMICKRCEPREIQEQKQLQTEKQQVRVRQRLDHF